MRTLLLLVALAASLYVNFEGARLAPPREVVERFFHGRAAPAFFWAKARVQAFLEGSSFSSLEGRR